MDLATQLPQLLGLAWLMPLASFVLILFFGPKMGPHGRNAAWVATAAIVTSLVLSLVAFVSWLGAHPVTAVHHGGDHGQFVPAVGQHLDRIHRDQQWCGSSLAKHWRGHLDDRSAGWHQRFD
jgi:hypothetical protein